MLQAGKLNRLVKLQSLTVARGTSGGQKREWADAGDVWASVRQLSGNERQASSAGGQVAVARTEFTIRYRPGIKATSHRVLGDDGLAYNIRHVSDYMARREFLVLTCDTGGDYG